jgi:hypothetical protein
VIAATPPFEPLGWVVNQWAYGDFPELLDKVRSGEFVAREGFGANPVSSADVEPAWREVWRTVSGDAALDEPVVVSSVMVYEPFVLPRTALVDILEKLGVLREAWAKDPQQPDPRASPPAASSPAAARQLFRSDPTGAEPSEVEPVLLADTEQLAIALDALAAAATTAEQLADVAVRRRVLLDELEASGILDAERAADKRSYLERWKLVTLVGYLDAAGQLSAYYAGTLRAGYQVPAPPTRLLDGHVSLDWFRARVATPAGATPDGWLAFCEGVLVDNAPSSAAGEILSKTAGRWYVIRYRVEARQHPVVVSARER